MLFFPTKNDNAGRGSAASVCVPASPNAAATSPTNLAASARAWSLVRYRRDSTVNSPVGCDLP